ncbi:nucleotidyltransferase domain-containing protein [Pseudactinotalea sp. HY160]|uniref:nucleotidyltransferase domain-containing protein n=1 Tax=Pseudactinotalea sp. HY160 TaxID=2654490 RepID=UPI00128C863C|nr:nucleotidyltransferase domain-containing protein [Pseudactinotalea sp. HY160]MPV48710.1 nucleotidyltransferase domain-containing protein [Pseudactinotalea sp. HY160]
MQLQHPFGVITPTEDGDVLTVLAGAQSSFTSGDVVRLAAGEWSRSGVRRSLDRLAVQGLVESTRVGSGYAFRLNRDHLAAEHVIAIANLRREFIERLRQGLRGAPHPPLWAAMFGSAARGEMSSDSDIDIFLVLDRRVDRDDWADWSTDFASDVTRWTGNDARLMEMTEGEVRDGAAGGDRILTSVAADAIVLVGERRWLHRQLRRAG